MLKRIKESFTMADVDQLEEDYMPTQDERENAGKTWEEVVEIRNQQNAFQGDY